MCLDTLLDMDSCPRIGYKVLLPGLCAPYRHTPFEIGVWKTDNSYKVLPTECDSDVTYETGFHCFLDLAAAQNMVRLFVTAEIYRVEMDDIVAVGTQLTYEEFRQSPCVVARKIKVLVKE